jgi:ubiquinone/menaquinone biosynthesis C-methylase UbiE
VPDAEFWNKRADRYAKRPVKDMASYQKTLDLTRKRLSTRDRVLEVGCGTGTTALHLAPNAGEILATDISQRMVEIGREKAAAQGVENVRFERGTLFDPELEAEPFDVVMAFNFLHLVEDIPTALRRVHGLLKPGGLFISKTVCLAEKSRLFALVLIPMKWVNLAPYVECLTIAELEGMVRDAGFEILETGSYPASPPSRFLVARKR